MLFEFGIVFKSIIWQCSFEANPRLISWLGWSLLREILSLGNYKLAVVKTKLIISQGTSINSKEMRQGEVQVTSGLLDGGEQLPICCLPEDIKI